MIYNTPFQDLQAVRSLKERIIKMNRSQYGYQPLTDLGVFYTDLEVGLCLGDVKLCLLKRFNLLSGEWVNLLVDESEYEFFLVQEVLENVVHQVPKPLEQPVEMAKALRFRLEII